MKPGSSALTRELRPGVRLPGRQTLRGHSRPAALVGWRHACLRRLPARLVRRPGRPRRRHAVPARTSRAAAASPRSGWPAWPSTTTRSAGSARSTSSAGTCWPRSAPPSPARPRPARLLGQPELDAVPDRHGPAHGGRRRTRAVAFVTSAYSSYSSCRQYLEDIERARAEVGPAAPRIDKIRPFSTTPASSSRSPRTPAPRWPRCPPTCATTPAWCSPRTASRSRWPSQRPGRASGTSAELTEAARLVAERAGGGTHAVGRWPTRAAAARPPSRGWSPTSAITWRAGQAGAQGRGGRAGRVRVRPHGGPVRPGRRGGRDGRLARAWPCPGGHPRQPTRRSSP